MAEKNNSNAHRRAPLLLSQACFALLAASSLDAAVIYPTGPGDTYFINTDLMDEVVVNDGAVPTTLTYQSGGASQGLTVNDNSVVNLNDGSMITSDGFLVNGNATLNVAAGATINGGSSNNNSGSVNFSGGSYVANLAFDSFDTSVTTIDGGSFNCSVTGRCLGAWDDASLAIWDANVTVSSNSNSSVFGRGSGSVNVGTRPTIDIFGGTFGGNLTASFGANMNIHGGTFSEVVSTGGNGNFFTTVTIFGSGFLATCDPLLGPAVCDAGETVINGFGIIDEAFSGTITGTLTDGSPLNVTDAFNQGPGNRIILAPSVAVPVPPAAWLFGSALGVLGWMRRKQN